MGLDVLLENQLDQLPKFQKLNLHLSTPFLPHGSKLSLCSLYEQRLSRYEIFKIAMLGHETWPLTTDPEVAQILSFYPRGSKLGLFSLYAQRFPRYGPIFKIAIFGHEFGHSPKFQLHIYPLSTLGGGGGGGMFK